MKRFNDGVEKADDNEERENKSEREEGMKLEFKF